MEVRGFSLEKFPHPLHDTVLQILVTHANFVWVQDKVGQISGKGGKHHRPKREVLRRAEYIPALCSRSSLSVFATIRDEVEA